MEKCFATIDGQSSYQTNVIYDKYTCNSSLIGDEMALSKNQIKEMKQWRDFVNARKKWLKENGIEERYKRVTFRPEKEVPKNNGLSTP